MTATTDLDAPTWEEDLPWIGAHQFIAGYRGVEQDYCRFCSGHRREHSLPKPKGMTPHKARHARIIIESFGANGEKQWKWRCLCGRSGNKWYTEDKLDVDEPHRQHVQYRKRRD